MRRFHPPLLLLSARVRANLHDPIPIYVGLVNAALLALSIFVVMNVFFHNTHSIGGWNQNKATSLYGAFIFIRSFVQGFVLPSCEGTARLVREKSLDAYLMRPIDTQLFLTFSDVRMWNIFGVILGLGCIMLGSWLDNRLTVSSVIWLAVALLVACVTVHAVWACVTSMSFWTKRTSNASHVLFMFLTIGRFPASSYPDYVRIIALSVLPVFFMMEVPAQAALGIVSIQTISIGGVICIGFVVLSKILWAAGIKRYLNEG